MIGPLSYLDAALLALGLISALLAMYRGLMRELLSIVSWIVAAGAGYLAFKKATWENSAIPGAILSPEEVIGEEERERLESQWNAKFRISF